MSESIKNLQLSIVGSIQKGDCNNLKKYLDMYVSQQGMDNLVKFSANNGSLALLAMKFSGTGPKSSCACLDVIMTYDNGKLFRKIANQTEEDYDGSTLTLEKLAKEYDKEHCIRKHIKTGGKNKSKRKRSRRSKTKKTRKHKKTRKQRSSYRK